MPAQSPYYQGKTITIITGSQTGDVFDIYARMIAAHMGKHIPGNPNMVVQNMTGAGHIVAANFVYSVAKPDGLTLLAPNPNLYIDQLIGRPEIKFDWAKFAWLGNASRTTDLLYMRTDAPFKTMEDVRSAKEPPKCGATGTGTTGYMVPRLLEETIGAKLTSSQDTKAATKLTWRWSEARFSAGRSVVTAFFGSRTVSYLAKKQLRARHHSARAKIETAGLADVPTLNELMEKYKTPEIGRRVAMVVTASEIFQRPYMGPPGMRPEHVKVVREAFQKTLKDNGVLGGSEEQEARRRVHIRRGDGIHG